MPFQYNKEPFPTRSISQTLLKNPLQKFKIRKLLKAKLNKPTRYYTSPTLFECVSSVRHNIGIYNYIQFNYFHYNGCVRRVLSLLNNSV
jgi:hypothetical protein